MKQEIEEILDSLIIAHRIETPKAVPDEEGARRNRVPVMVVKGCRCLCAGVSRFFKR